MSDIDTYQPIDYGVDPPLEEFSGGVRDTVAVIRTSDRISFKRCRRRWGWSSHLGKNLGSRNPVDALWFGTGIHYALEDYHGYNKWGSPRTAFDTYCKARTRLKNKTPLPPSYDELEALGCCMMEYYLQWLSERDSLKTFWYKGVPQVEVKGLIPVPFDPRSMYPDSSYSRVLYSVTIDRVIEDSDGFLWPIDYKTAKMIQTQHFATDPQIGAYYWAMSHLYPDHLVGGFIYQQHRKDTPNEPRITAAGRLSTDKKQLTTHRAYRKALVNIFGSQIERWPHENLEMLNYLAGEETAEADRYIRRDKIYRNQHSHEAEGTKILLEIEDMLNPNLPLYPNPTRDCSWCPFLHSCICMDEGGDFEQELELNYITRQPEDHDTAWRQEIQTLHNNLQNSQDSSPKFQW
jgi:hypothetical protein